jgi:hypothetical protein
MARTPWRALAAFILRRIGLPGCAGIEAAVAVDVLPLLVLARVCFILMIAKYASIGTQWWWL